MTARYFVQIIIHTWAPRREPDPKTKSSRSHLKISTNLSEICWKCLRMTACYFVQICTARSTRGPILKAKHMIYMETGFYVIEPV
jgi:hypothetical protein